MPRLPVALEIEALVRRLFPVSGPVGNAVFVDQDVGPDDLGARLPQAVHEPGVAFQVDILHDAENAALRVDRTGWCRLVVDPHLGQIVTDEMVAGHGGGGFAAPAGRRPGQPGHPAARAFDAGDEHVLGQFSAPVFVDGLVDREPVVALFQQQGVAGIGAVEAVGGPVAAIHEHPRIGKVFGPVEPLAVDVGEKMP